MASGFGLRGNVGRCFYFYSDFASCMVISMFEIILYRYYSLYSKKTSDEPVKECVELRDDYLECLHHRKEVSTWKI